MCLCCQVLYQYLCFCCLRSDNKEVDKRSEQKKHLAKNDKSYDSSVKIKWKRVYDSPNKRLSEKSEEEVFKPIVLPIDNIDDPLVYMKKQNFEVLTEEYIDRGNYGEVFKAIQSEPNDMKTLIACKVIIIKESRKRDKMINSLRKELYTLENLKYYHIIQTIKHFIFEYMTEELAKEIKAFIFMEYASEGNLEKEVENSGPFDNDNSKRYFGQIASGLRFMHQKAIAHRDLKLENILLVKTPNNPKQKDCKISDFGMSQIVYKTGVGFVKADQYLGTRPYMAPEVIKVRVSKAKGDDKPKWLQYEPMPVDCWAMGVIAYRLLTKEFPFYLFESTHQCLQKAIKDQINKNWSFPRNIYIDETAQELIRRCLEPDVSKRLDMYSIITHPWLEGETSLSTTT